jgi:putative endonuclease
MLKTWYVYIILTEKGKLYTGITVDIERRFLEHLSLMKGAKFFRSDPVDRLVYVEECLDRSHASMREYAIKQLSSTKKWELVKEYGLLI